METIIKVHPSELNSTLLNKIRDFVGNKKNVEVTISLKEFDPGYAEDLDRSLEEADTGNIISFTMEEFVAYKPKSKQ